MTKFGNYHPRVVLVPIVSSQAKSEVFMKSYKDGNPQVFNVIPNALILVHRKFHPNDEIFVSV